jgi:hypothetical protein
LEDLNSINNFSSDSISHSRQGWQYLVQRILNNEFSNELQILQLKLDSNIFQQYQIKENQRIYKVHIVPLLYLPSHAAIQSILFRVGSIVQYPTIIIHIAHRLITPLVEQKQDISGVLISPKWRHSIDEQHLSSYNSDDKPQMTMHTNSYQDEPLSSFNNLFFRKHHRNSTVDKFYDNNLPLRSISYGFDLGSKTRTRETIQQDTRISSVNYRLPANKIELDRNQ